MIALNEKHRCVHSNWQADFTRMLPEIERRLRRAFRHLNTDAREEAISDGVMHCLLAYVRLHEQEREQVASPSTLVFYASRRVKCGRAAVGSTNSKDVLSRYAQISREIQIETSPGQWLAAIVDDKRAPVPEQVAAKIDVGAWFATLSYHVKAIATDLALGFTTSELATKYCVTSGRISQLRRKLERSWQAFSEGVRTA